jgi:hypothetical protein
MTTLLTSRRLVWASVILLWCALIAAPTQAHLGGTPLLINEPAGPFLVSVWSLPNPLVANQEANLIVAISEPTAEARAGVVILDAEIAIELTQGGEQLWVYPSHDEATNKLFYEGYFTFPTDGTWAGSISLNKDGETGTATFSATVAPGEATGINWLWVGVTAVFLIGIGWFMWQQKSSAQPQTKSEQV